MHLDRMPVFNDSKLFAVTFDTADDVRMCTIIQTKIEHNIEVVLYIQFPFTPGVFKFVLCIMVYTLMVFQFDSCFEDFFCKDYWLQFL